MDLYIKYYGYRSMADMTGGGNLQRLGASVTPTGSGRLSVRPPQSAATDHRPATTAPWLHYYRCEPVWPSGKALGWYAEGPRFGTASAVLLLQKLWSVDTLVTLSLTIRVSSRASARFRCPFPSKKVVVCGHCLATLYFTMNKA